MQEAADGTLDAKRKPKGRFCDQLSAFSSTTSRWEAGGLSHRRAKGRTTINENQNAKISDKLGWWQKW